MRKSYMHGLVLAALLVPASLPAATIELNPNHPERYIVQKGDTLWDISARFLRDPWYWPEIWEVNPDIQNPHLIYPGDEIVLTYEGGKPVLRVRRDGRPTVKLSPAVRTLSGSEGAIATLPLDAIKEFLNRSRVVTDGELENAPYIVSLGEEHLVGGEGFKVYARGLDAGASSRYGVFRRGEAYRNPDAEDEILGYEALYVGDSVVERPGDPSTLMLTDTAREVLAGDRLFPLANDAIADQLVPNVPGTRLEGKIISVIDGVSQIGQYQVVVINLGTEDGAAPGDVMAVYQTGATIRDRFAKSPKVRSVVNRNYDLVTLPNERAGVVVVFRTFERVSYALVMKATRAIHVLDTVTNP